MSETKTVKKHSCLYVLAMSRTRFRVNPHSIAQSFGQFGEMFECSFMNQTVVGSSPFAVT